MRLPYMYAHMTTTETDAGELTDRGIHLGQEYQNVIDEYLSYDVYIAYEDDNVIIFVDESRHDIGEWATDLSESWEDVNTVMHDVARGCVRDAHLVFSAVDPIVFVKPAAAV